METYIWPSFIICCFVVDYLISIALYMYVVIYNNNDDINLLITTYLLYDHIFTIYAIIKQPCECNVVEFKRFAVLMYNFDHLPV